MMLHHEYLSRLEEWMDRIDRRIKKIDRYRWIRQIRAENLRMVDIEINVWSPLFHNLQIK